MTNLLSKFFSFNGRISRSEYWVRYVCLYIIFIVYSISAYFGWKYAVGKDVFLGAMLLILPLLFIVVVMQFSLTIRRLHDFGQTGWLSLLLFAPYIQTLVTLVIGVIPPETKDNKYGPYIAKPVNVAAVISSVVILFILTSGLVYYAVVELKQAIDKEYDRAMEYPITGTEQQAKDEAYKYIIAREEVSASASEKDRQYVRLHSEPDVYRAYVNGLYETQQKGSGNSIEAIPLHVEIRPNPSTGGYVVEYLTDVVEKNAGKPEVRYNELVKMELHFDASANLTPDQRVTNPDGCVIGYYSTVKMLTK